MPSYNLAKLRGDQPNLWPSLVLPACLLACEASPGSVSSFELSYLAPEAKDPAVEAWSITHAVDFPAADLEALARADRRELLDVAAAGVLTSILRARNELRVRHVSRRGAGLDFYLERLDGRDAGVLCALGAAGADAASALAEAVKHAEGAPWGRKIAGVVAFGGGKATIRVLS
jgi:hypothetical protein